MSIEGTSLPEVNLSLTGLSKSLEVPHGFQISQNGRSASKSLKVIVGEETKELVFTVFFPPKRNEAQKIEFLKQFNPEKVQALGKTSVELGVGEKFKSISFNQDDLGNLKNIELFKTNGKSKTLNEEVFNRKEKSLIGLNDDEKLKKLESRKHLFHSIEKILKNDLSPLELHKKPDQNTKSEEERIQERLREIQSKKKSLSTQKKQNSEELQNAQNKLSKLEQKIEEDRKNLHGYYLNGRPVAEILDELFDQYKFTTKEEAKKFFDKFIDDNIDKITKSV